MLKFLALRAEELLQAANDPELDLRRAFVRTAPARGDIAFGTFVAERLVGFCYGGPYAILGPKRLGYDAGISCHGTQMLDFLKDLDGARPGYPQRATRRGPAATAAQGVVIGRTTISSRA